MEIQNRCECCELTAWWSGRCNDVQITKRDVLVIGHQYPNDVIVRVRITSDYRVFVRRDGDKDAGVIGSRRRDVPVPHQHLRLAAAQSFG